MGYRQDLDACYSHLKTWIGKLKGNHPSDDLISKCMDRVNILHHRLSLIQPSDSDEESKRNLSVLKVEAVTFRKGLEELANPFASPDRIPPAQVRSLDDWTMNASSNANLSQPHSSVVDPIHSQSSRNTNSTHQTSYDEDAIVNASISFQESSDRLLHLNRTNIVESTRNPYNSRFNPPSSEAFDHFSSTRPSLGNDFIPSLRNYRPGNDSKIQVWKWDLKFSGEPDSIQVIEFIRRAKKLARSRGATKADLFNAACDLLKVVR